MEIKPFRAFRYDDTIVGDVGNCVAPPYDVISPDQLENLYQKSEYNIARITKGKTTPSDNNGDNQYTRAAEYLSRWIQDGAIRQDAQEAIYGYVQDFEALGRRFQRMTFIALGKLEDFGKTVRAHEQIMHEPIVDRLNLKRATAARFGLVFMLYKDDQNIADKIIESAIEQKPLIDFVDENGVRHRLFAITDKNDIHAIAEMMLDKNCIIADGHHRYTTGLLYSKENPNPAAKYQMLAFTNTRHEGLVILAVHRLINNLDTFDFDKLIAGLKEDFDIAAYPFDSAQAKTHARQKMLAQMKAEHARGRNAFGIYAAGGAFYVALLRNSRAMDAVAPEKSPPWRSLDVAVLHRLILEPLLGIGEKQLAAGTNVEYVKDTSDAVNDLIARVDKGQKQLAFFMNPTRIEQVQMVAHAGERMPQKSTYFYPKVYTGLTINKL